eukprot:426418_1
MSKVKLYGVAPSQPTRAVLFLLELKNEPYEFIKVNPGAPRSQKKDYIDKINPSGKVPGLEDNGFTLYESAAIMTYLATKNQWEDLYPCSDLKRRALIDQYLHWHHENTRKVTTGFLVVLLRQDIDISKFNPSTLITTRKLAKYSLNIIENVWLSKHDYIVDNKLSLADFLCYEELVQLKQWDIIPNVNTKYPNIFKWIGRMEKLNGHDKVHRILKKMDGYIAKRLKACQPLLSKL